MTAPAASPQTLQTWAARNWKIIAAALVATGAVSLLVYSLAKASPPPPAPGTPPSSASARRKRKSKSGSKRSNNASASEASSPSAAAAAEETSAGSSAVALNADDAASKEPINTRPSHLFPEDISTLTQEARATLAQEAKTIGNKLYAGKKYNEALELYSQAILLHPTAVYYGNRAAAYSNLYEFENAIADCNEALKLDSKYLKALHRRATAYEQLHRHEEALNDFTAICVLEGFRNQSSMSAPDRVLKQIVAEKTKVVIRNKVPKMPSPTFISAYLESFRATPTHADIVANSEQTEATKHLSAAFDAVKNHQWEQALQSVQQSIEIGEFGSPIVAAIAYNLDATFQFLMGRTDAAVASIERSLELDPNNINSIIKRATLYMEQGTPEKTLEMFNKAEKLSPQNVDLFYHRGQVLFLTGDFKGAVEDYSQSLKYEKPDESSVYVHIQMGVAKYKLGDLGGAEKKFKEAKRLFPKSAEVFNYHGEILMDREAFTEALKCFDKSIEMDPDSPLPYINKSLLLLQWKQNISEAETQCRLAIEKDPLCDIAYTHLGQLLCHQTKIEEALDVYDQAAAVSRTEAEISNVLSCREAANAQLHVMKSYPGVMESIALSRQ